MTDKFSFLTDGSLFMPHGHCFLWDPILMWVYSVSDALIAVSYGVLSAALVYFVRKRRDLAFKLIFLMFGAFILLCGMTHFMDVWTLWTPSYLEGAVVRVACAAVSVATAVTVWPSLSTALALPSPEQLEAANKELESFSYSISHDLRAPLRAISGFSRILLEDYSDKLDAEGQRVLNVVCDSTLKMNRMIDDVLAFSRVGRSEMAMASVDMEVLVGAAIKELENATAGRNVKFEIGALPQARGDASLIQHVWTNLLDNAVKFTAPKADAIIQVGADAGDNETIYYVRDNGVGFDMQYVDKLFGVFQRLHGAEFVGSGVGLAVVKRVVTRHGGRVWAQGKPSEGATFFFVLPKRRADHV
jgi:signal transduction histidine kinase